MTAMGMNDQPRQVRITTDGTRAHLEVDGHDLSRLLHGYTLEQHAGQPPMLILHAHTDQAGVAFEGLAHVVVGDDPDPADTITGFLASLDAATLERAALERDDMAGGRYDVTRAILAQLADWARGH